MDTKKYFLNPDNRTQRQYEALRLFYIENVSAKEVSQKFGFTENYFKKLRFQFSKQIKNEQNPYFSNKKTGPKTRFTRQDIIDNIIELRKKNYSILDIKATLDTKEQFISVDTIDKILKAEGFAPLPRRTQQEKQSLIIPNKIKPPLCRNLQLNENEEFFTEKGAAPLIFLPLIQELGIIDVLQKCNFPQTSTLNDISNILSFLALKIMGNERLSHDESWQMDRALGLFAGLNVLPKSSTLSSYSYRITREVNKKFITALGGIFKSDDVEEGEFNLDFKAIPHWGDMSVLEKNWSGSRNRSIKSLLGLIVQDPSTGFISFTNANLKHTEQNDAIFEFIDFWKEGRGIAPKLLIFDSKFTTYENLSKLNQSDEKIHFLTLRRRSKNLVEKIENSPQSNWKSIKLDFGKRKHQNIRYIDESCKLRKYKGELRQIVLIDNGRQKPTFLITNDFDLSAKNLICKYARRWLVEQEIAEQVVFFHLNQASSSIVVKVDFDLTMSLLAHNLYKVLSSYLPGFENCTVPTIYRNFLENGAQVKIIDDKIIVSLKKKSHLPILFELPWLKKETFIPWMNKSIAFQYSTTS